MDTSNLVSNNTACPITVFKGRVENTWKRISCLVSRISWFSCHPIHLVFHFLWGLQCCSPVWQRLTKQLEDLDVPFTEDFPAAIKSTDHIVDAIFGWSFKYRTSACYYMLIDYRFQFLRRGPRAISSRHPGFGRDQDSGDLCRCSVVVEH